MHSLCFHITLPTASRQARGLCWDLGTRLSPSQSQPDSLSDASRVAVGNFLPLCQLRVPACVRRLRIASTSKGCGMALNKMLLPEAQRTVWNGGGAAPVPAAIIIPREGEQEMEERLPGRRGSRVGRKPDRRQTDGGGLWAPEAGTSRAL